MTFLPICIDIDKKKILLIGGGKTALHKLKTLLLYSSDITLIALDILPEIQKLGIRTIKKEYELSDLDGYFLIYAVTNNKALNQQIKNDANTRKLLVNVCDQPLDSDFTSPAVYKKQEMSVAVSSNAINVQKSIAWRDKIKRGLEND